MKEASEEQRKSDRNAIQKASDPEKTKSIKARSSAIEGQQGKKKAMSRDDFEALVEKSQKSTLQRQQIDTLVGNRLRLCRLYYGLSQHEVADHVGLSFQQIQKYETHKNRIAADTLYKLTNFFDVPIDWFYEENQEAPTQNICVSDKYASHFIHCYKNMTNDRVKSLIREIIVQLVKTQNQTMDQNP